MLRHGSRLVDALPDLMIMQAPRAVVTFAVASVGWLLLHLARRRPGWIGYALLAVGVVIVGQSISSLPIAIFTPAALEPLNFMRLMGGLLALHGWFSIPLALAGTALFVRWIERGAKAPPSPDAPAGSRS